MNKDKINPSHYQTFHKEVWEMMLDIWGKEKYIAHCEMCAFKYRMRFGNKEGEDALTELGKAKWYENMAIKLRKDEA